MTHQPRPIINDRALANFWATTAQHMGRRSKRWRDLALALARRYKHSRAQANLGLILAQRLIADDTGRTCPFCDKDEWGESQHDSECPLALAYTIRNHALAEAGKPTTKG